ncbi:phosphatidylserine decarboxylase [Candidatus Woesearchaeota archaeon]|nr:phosphatidylserine decarboxylase [Candidatus Woesearchaeota archaeon]
MISNLLFIVAIVIIVFLVWKFLWFERDPKRAIPGEENIIVSPADGTVVYIKSIEKNTVPTLFKNGKPIRLDEITHIKEKIEASYLIGIFMNPFSVHINRSPIDGKISSIKHDKHKNLTMIGMLFKVIFHRKGLPENYNYIFRNERNTIVIEGQFKVIVVQIADSIINKVVCWKKVGETIRIGEKIGMIKMGSQVDLIIPKKVKNQNIKIKVKEGEYIHAGETIVGMF